MKVVLVLKRGDAGGCQTGPYELEDLTVHPETRDSRRQLRLRSSGVLLAWMVDGAWFLSQVRMGGFRSLEVRPAITEVAYLPFVGER